MTFSKKWSAPFIVFVIAGTVIPILSIAYYGFTSRGGGITLDNVTAMFSANHMQALGLSLLLALVSTLVCLIVPFRWRSCFGTASSENRALRFSC